MSDKSDNFEGAFDSWATRFGALGVLQILRDQTPAVGTVLYSVLIIALAALWFSAQLPLWRWKGKLVHGDNRDSMLGISLYFLSLVTTLVASLPLAQMLNAHDQRVGLFVYFIVILVLVIPVIISGGIHRKTTKRDEAVSGEPTPIEVAQAPAGQTEQSKPNPVATFGYTVGDTVVLKSGGPSMTVEEISAIFTNCVWGEGGVVRKGYFAHGTVEKHEQIG